jgi:hypothetical protein
MYGFPPFFVSEFFFGVFNIRSRFLFISFSVRNENERIFNSVKKFRSFSVFLSLLQPPIKTFERLKAHPIFRHSFFIHYTNPGNGGTGIAHIFISPNR